MILTLALVLIPKDFLYTLPTFVQYLLGSPILVASLAAILLNKFAWCEVSCRARQGTFD